MIRWVGAFLFLGAPVLLVGACGGEGGGEGGAGGGGSSAPSSSAAGGSSGGPSSSSGAGPATTSSSSGAPACPEGFADCNHLEVDGCEVDLRSDVAHCGKCGEACASDDGPVSCEAGACRVECPEGRAACDGGLSCSTSTDVDPENCGACGKSCLGGGCNAGACSPAPSVLASGIASPGDVAIRGDALYVTSRVEVSNGVYGGRLYRVPLAGGEPVLLASDDTRPFVDLDVDATHAYLAARYPGQGVYPAALLRVPLEGGEFETLAAEVSKLGPPLIAASPGGVYVSDYEQSAISVVPLGGGAPQKVADAPNPSDIVADATHVYWVASNIEYGPYGAETHDGLVQRLAIGGTTVETIAKGQAGVADVVTDASSVYWSNFGVLPSSSPYPVEGAIAKAPLGGGPVEVLVEGATYASSIAVDEGRLYYKVHDRLFAVPKSGGAPTMIGSDVGAIAVSADRVFWSSSKAQAVVYVTK